MATGYLDNFYARLGLQINATELEIKDSYYQAARKFHPDANNQSGSAEIFLQIQEAYEILSNPKQRSLYDETLPNEIKGFNNILTNAIYSRDTLGINNSKQLLYVLLNIAAFPNVDKKEIKHKPPLNISIVIDNSTSMKGERLEAVKSTTIKLIKNLKPEDYISIIAFNDKATIVLPATQHPNINIVESQISQLSTSGGTELFQGLTNGAHEIDKFYSQGLINHLIILTDGKTYGDEDKCLALAKELGKKGVAISGLGIGKDWNEEFMDDLVKVTGGESVYANDSEAISTFLNSKFFELSNTYATNVHLNYILPENAELKYVFRISPNTNSLQKDPLILGDLPLGNSLTILMEFLIDKVQNIRDPFVFMEGSLNMTIPGKEIPIVEHKFSLSRPIVQNPKTEPPPQMLIRALSKLSMYRLQEEAYLDIKRGDKVKATRKLNNLATQLLVSGEPVLAHTVLLEVDKLEGGSDIKSGKEKKQIKYGTRALLLPSGKEFP